MDMLVHVHTRSGHCITILYIYRYYEHVKMHTYMRGNDVSNACILLKWNRMKRMNAKIKTSKNCIYSRVIIIIIIIYTYVLIFPYAKHSSGKLVMISLPLVRFECSRCDCCNCEWPQIYTSSECTCVASENKCIWNNINIYNNNI